ncbi:MAG: glycosyltransferase family 4 protein [Patescibacteria group bacterium]
MPHQPYRSITKHKLLFLCRLFWPHIGGVETHVLQLSMELLKRGYEITIITEQHDSSLPLLEEQYGIHIFRIPQASLKNKWTIWTWMYRHISLLMLSNIVHAHDVMWWYWPFRFLFLNKSTYTTFHGYEGANEPHLGAILSRKMSEFLSRKTICIGDWMRKWYHTNPNAVSYGAATCSPASVFQVKPNSIVFIGRLSEDTGILVYIHAVQFLKGKFSLDIFGEGPLKQEILKMIYDSPFITYQEETVSPEKELARHRYAFVSRYLAMIEAQQVGRFVFAQWDTAIKRDYLRSLPTADCIHIFHDPKDLVKGLEDIQKHPEKEKRFIKKAQTWAVHQRWSKAADMYEELWEK